MRLEVWVAERLAHVEDKARYRLLRPYATWRVLRRARQERPITDNDERWATARLPLHDEGIELTDRVAGLLVPLYGP